MEQIVVELIQWRALERILATIVGGLSIVAGWHLFLRGVVQNQVAEFEAQSLKVSFQKVGPGVFFAAFGVWLVASVVTTQAELESIDPESAAAVNEAIGPKIPANKPRQIKLAYVTNQRNGWSLPFVSAAKTIEDDFTVFQKVIGQLERDERAKIQNIVVALSQITLARRRFLIDTFPPDLNDACKNGSPFPSNYSQDDCQKLKEFTEANLTKEAN